MKIIPVLVSLAALALVGCETTAGYRKSAGGQVSNKTVKLSLKNVEIAGNLTLDLDDGQSSVGDADQGGTAQAAASGNEVKDSLNGNDVAPVE